MEELMFTFTTEQHKTMLKNICEIDDMVKIISDYCEFNSDEEKVYPLNLILSQIQAKCSVLLNLF